MMTWRKKNKQKKTSTKARPGPAWLWVVVQDKPSRNLAGQHPIPELAIEAYVNKRVGILASDETGRQETG